MTSLDGPWGAGATMLSRRIEEIIFEPNEGLMKSQAGLGFRADCDLRQALGAHKSRCETHEKPIPWGEIRGSFLRAIEDDELVFEEQGLGSDAAYTTRPH